MPSAKQGGIKYNILIFGMTQPGIVDNCLILSVLVIYFQIK